ncbi:MAG: hypothetical protein HRT36_05050 [Alphaproteobacteria bacterium]|nr:hypothetical protein [Alphaproteobacteria bacterium]
MLVLNSIDPYNLADRRLCATACHHCRADPSHRNSALLWGDRVGGFDQLSA